MNHLPEGAGSAGLADPDARSDLFVRAHLRQSGGVQIDVHSKVAAMYGQRIRAEVSEVLDRLGITHARVEIEDRGALPFVVVSRVEAALRQAGWQGVSVPERTAPLPPPSPRDRMRRSRLYLPGNEPKFMVNAALHGPNAVILDLEDSVHPDHKVSARILVRNALRLVDFGSAERMVRINQLPLGMDDLDEVIPALPDLILIPKVEDPDAVRAVSERIDALLPGPDARPVWLMPILESALGIERAFEIARASERVVALTLGLEDYTADLGVPKTLEGPESLYARTRVVNAARAAGLQAIDSVFGDVGNMEGLTAWARASRGLGFEGMGCVHPRQIGPIHEAFAPSAAELEKAERIVAAFELAEAEGRSVVSLGSRMIDPPVVTRARRLVARARS